MADNSQSFTTFRARDLRIIRNADGAVHFDGEPASMPRILDVICHHAGLRLFSTEKKTRLRPLLAPEIPLLSPLALTIRDLRFKIYNLFQ